MTGFESSMEALSLLAKQSDEPEAQLTMQSRISEYFAGAVDQQAALESLRKATCQSRGRAGRARVLGRRGKVRRSNSLIASGWVWTFGLTLALDQAPLPAMARSSRPPTWNGTELPLPLPLNAAPPDDEAALMSEVV